MSEAVVAQRAPYKEMVEAGKSYWWCRCGRSSKQPYCDGAHRGTGFTPMEYKAEESKAVFFCGCKATGKSPMCDGTHKNV